MKPWPILITSVGLSVETLKSAREFLEHERPDAPACLVLDVRLPGLSGLDLQQELLRTKTKRRSRLLIQAGDFEVLVQELFELVVDGKLFLKARKNLCWN